VYIRAARRSQPVVVATGLGLDRVWPGGRKRLMNGALRRILGSFGNLRDWDRMKAACGCGGGVGRCVSILDEFYMRGAGSLGIDVGELLMLMEKYCRNLWE
jgi:hypothetical protein